MTERKQTLFYKNKPYIIGSYAVGGEKERESKMKSWFDYCSDDNTFGQKSWEKAESKMLKTAIVGAIQKTGKNISDIDAMLSGDLLNQLMSSSFMARDLQIPFLGLYGACSTMTEAILLASSLVNASYFDNVVAGASSHYCTAERQFRMPLEHGNQRPPSAQWTATAAGAMVISKRKMNESLMSDNNGNTRQMYNVRVDCSTVGKIIDAGVKDANMMGSAMAPAAIDTILTHLKDTKRSIEYYDIVLTGDLGEIGKAIVKDMLFDAGLNRRIIDRVYDDCGTMMYENFQDVHSGASGCGCSASIFSSYVLKKMRRGDYKRALIISTGALLSTISASQGESIPGIAHAVSLEVEL